MRPFRGRALAAYAGCMTAVRAAAIDRAYSSRPQPLTGSMGPAGNFVFDEILLPCSREAGHGHGNAPIQGDQDFISGMRFTRRYTNKISKKRPVWNLVRAAAE